jgi:RNA polymerase sigma-70 factor (ECF subfamily)
MENPAFQQRLSRITTLWTVVCQAHDGSGEAAATAQRQLLDRYGGAVRRYLQAVVRTSEAADELFQEFAVRLLHGDLRGADPDRGRFRNFVKGVLFHMVADHHQRQRRQPFLLSPEHPEPAVPPPSLEAQQEFLTSWRDELLAKSWSALEALERETGQPFYTVLRFRADHPGLRSPEMAEQLTRVLGKPVTAAGMRQTLHRAREKFADLLLDEVVHSLQNPTAEDLEQELSDLRLLDYCRPALERRGPAD